jgi:acyl-CoA thioesterase-1
MTVGDFVLQDGQTVVMIGDSITACGCQDDGAPLGGGYVQLVHGLSVAKYPERKIHFVNAGVNGNTISDLAGRWEADVLARRPKWLSISVGINDVWRQLDTAEGGVEVGRFTAVYRELLETTRSRLSGCGFILLTPGIIGEDPDSEGNRLLRPYVESIRQLAPKFNAFCVPIHDAYLDAIAAGSTPLTHDGVHPNAAGHALMALTWLNTLGW